MFCNKCAERVREWNSTFYNISMTPVNTCFHATFKRHNCSPNVLVDHDCQRIDVANCVDIFQRVVDFKHILSTALLLSLILCDPPAQSSTRIMPVVV